MARRKPSNDPPSHDSFLDIVANLVGILIILIMVVGIQAKSAMVTASIEVKEEKKATPDVATPKKATKNLSANLHEVEKQIREHKFHVNFRQAERDKTLTLIQKAKGALNKKRNELSDSQKEKFDRRQKMIRGESQLRQLQDERIAVNNSKAPPVKVQHLPTPMVQTVFGKELHLRLKAGRICFVPLQKLVARMKAQLPEKFQRLRNQSVVKEVIGPVDGFKMQYVLSIGVARMETKFGPQARKIGQFTKAELIPVTADLGESVDAALRSGSDLDQRLRLRNPRLTTVTVWVYPDSYGEFRRVKETLFKRGFLTAARPLPKDQRIGLSPDGSRSAAQ